MTDTPKLLSIFFSPWSLRVKWALQALKFPYETVNYDLIMGEWQLRLKLWRWRVTVPVLFASDATLTDGVGIVKYAQAHKDDSAQDILIDGVDEWMATADDLMGMLRHRSFMTILGSEDAIARNVPSAVRWMGPIGIMLTRSALNKMAAKYPTPYDEGSFETAISRVRSAIQNSSSGYLLGTFSYADICIASMCQMLRPLPDDRLKLPRSLRPSFTQEDVAVRCEDILEWRDKIVAQHWPL